MLFNRDFGIDLGSDTIKIYDEKNDSFYKSRNLIAVRKKEAVIAVGDEAYEMLEMTPRDVDVTVPMSSGRISDVVLAETIIEGALFSREHFFGVGLSLYFSVPADMTEIERRAYASISRRGRLKNCRVYLVEKPLADAVSFGISPTETLGSVIVNIGSLNTEMSVLADSRIILNRMVPLSGKTITDSVIAFVRRKNKLAVGQKTAAELKLELSGLDVPLLPGVTVYGSDTDSGLPRDGYVTASTVNGAIKPSLENLCFEISEFLQRTPPQVLARVRKEGINLCGGTSRIPGIGGFIAKRTGYSVNVSPEHESSVIYGLRELIKNKSENAHLFRALNR